MKNLKAFINKSNLHKVSINEQYFLVIPLYIHGCKSMFDILNRDEDRKIVFSQDEEGFIMTEKEFEHIPRGLPCDSYLVNLGLSIQDIHDLLDGIHFNELDHVKELKLIETQR